jgi:hypothetical protein
VPGPWLTDLQVKDRLASILEVSGGGTALPAFWDERVLRCHAAAWKAIRSILLGRGYTVAQLDTWDEREEYEGDISAAFCLRDGLADQLDSWPRIEGDDRDYALPETQPILRHLDRRGELYALTLVDTNGDVIEVAVEDTVEGSRVGHGAMSSTGDCFGPVVCPPRSCCGGSGRDVY